MISTSTPLGPEFVKELIPWLIQQFGIAAAKTFRMFWDIGMTFLSQHWIVILVVLFAVLVYAVFRALMGHWWVLGSVIYNYLYFGILFIVGRIWGPEVFANDYFKFFLLILYVVCFTLVGKILNKIK